MEIVVNYDLNALISGCEQNALPIACSINMQNYYDRQLHS